MWVVYVVLMNRFFVNGLERQGDLDQFLAILRHFLQPFLIVLVVYSSSMGMGYVMAA